MVHSGKRIDRNFTMRKFRSPERRQRWGILIGIAILILAIGIFKHNQKPLQPDVLATVNGQSITLTDLDRFQKLVSQAHLSTAQLLEQVINQQLLLQEAQKRGVSVSTQEVNVFIVEALKQQNATPQDLQQVLQKRHMSIAELGEAYREQLTISKLLQSIMPQVSEDQVTQFYNQNQAAFAGKDPTVAQGEIRAALENQQMQTALPGFLSALRNRSDVRIQAKR